MSRELRKEQTIRANVNDAKTVLQTYIEHNQNRGVFRRNKTRDAIFNELVQNIETIENAQYATLSLQLAAIQKALQDATDKNNDLNKRGAHTGLSSNALFEASQLIDSAIAAEKIAVVEKRAAEAESKLRDEKAAEVKRKQEELNARESEKRKPFIADPVNFLKEKIHNHQLSESDVNVVLSNITKPGSERARLVPLNDVQKRFYADLEKEFTTRELKVSDAIVYLITQSPLMHRYEALTNAHDIRQMIQTIGDIVRISHQNNQGLLHDLHHLFIAEDETALHEILTLLQQKKMLTVKTPVKEVTQEDQAALFKRSDATMRNLLTQTILPNQMLNMDKLAEVLTAVNQSPENAPDKPEVLAAPGKDVSDEQLQLVITQATHQLYESVKLSTVTAQLMNDITVNSQEMIALTRTMGEKRQFPQLENIATRLTPQFKLLIGLIEIMKGNEEKCAHIFVELKNAALQREKKQSAQKDERLFLKMQQLMKDFDVWNRDFKHVSDALQRALQSFNGALAFDPSQGLLAANALITVSQQSQAEFTLKEKIRADIEKVLSVLSQRAANKKTHISMENVDATPEEPQLNLFFVVLIANKSTRRSVDLEPLIDLIRALCAQGLLTRQIQNKLLRQDNVRELLQLQAFLDASHLSVTSVQLCQLWDTLDGNKDFKLLAVLQKRFHFSVETVITIFENLSRTWDRSLLMLATMFDNIKLGNESVLLTLIHATKYDHLLIEKIYKVFDAIVKHQSAFLTDFFSQMPKLIDCIQTREYRFADELTVRLQASDYAPFKPTEDWSYLLDRTIQYDERNLSYINILRRWKENATEHVYFDDMSRMILGSHTIAQYQGAHQINATNKDDSVTQNGPDIDNTADANWDNTRSTTTAKPVDIDAIKAAQADKMISTTQLSLEFQVLLPIVQMIIQSHGALAIDDNNHPAYVVLLSKDHVGPIVDYYLYFTIAQLRDAVDALKTAIEKAQTLHKQLVDQKIIADKPFLIDLAHCHEAASMQPVVLATENSAILTEYTTLLNCIASANKQLMDIATRSVREAFEAPIPSLSDNPYSTIANMAANSAAMHELSDKSQIALKFN